MHPRTSWFLGIVIALLLFFIFFMPSVGAHLRELLGPQIATSENGAELAAENASLEARLAELAVVANELPTAPADTVQAMVYSNYPFNFKNEIAVAAGSGDGVAAHDAVLFEGNLVGVVAETAPHESLIQTIFDPDFKLPVRIGSAGYDALLTGGAYPMVESIAKTAKVSAGDIVYNAGSLGPYAAAVGEIANVATAPNNLFQEASLSFPYDMSNLQAVEIVR
jgi:cell shape-determining protein MreC